jgi:hypothetical protein
MPHVPFYDIKVFWGDRFDYWEKKVSFNRNIVIIIMLVSEDYIMYCGQEIDIICHPRP